MTWRNLDLWASVAWAAAGGAVQLLPLPILVRAPCGLLLALFCPGYALAAALFPRRSLGWPERLLLTLGLSLSAIILGAVLFNALPWGLQTGVWVSWLFGLTLVASLVAARRRPITLQSNSTRRVAQGLGIEQWALLGAAGLLTVSAVVLARAPRPATGVLGYTVMWMTPSEGVRLGISSDELHPAHFRLEVTLNGRLIQNWPDLILAPGENWERQIALPSRQSGEIVEAVLYRTATPDLVYRRVGLWLNRKEVTILKILLVSDNYPPFFGGAHRQTQLLGRELLRRGHAVTVATVWHGGLPEYENDAGVDVYRLKQLRTWLPGGVKDKAQRYQPPWPDPITTWGLRQIIDRFEPDVVHVYGWFAYSAAVALLGKRIPLLISGRDYAYGCAKRTLLWHDQPCSGPSLLKCLDCAPTLYGRPKGWAAVLGVYLGGPLLRRKVTGIHSVSTYVQAMTRRDFLDDRAASAQHPVALSVIPSFQEDNNGASNSESADLQRYCDQLPSTPYILFVGALRMVKGLKPLLAAYAQLSAPPPLVLIGTVDADTPRVFPPGVVVLQNFPHRAILAAWDRCLFGALPSLWPEPLGSVVYEGMSRGKAVIGTTPGGHTDIIVHGESGLLVPTGDVPALTAAMQSLLTNPDLRERLGRGGRVRAKRFTAEFAVPLFEQLYQQLVDQAAGQVNENHSLRLGQG